MRTAARVLARAAYLAGNQTQDFSMYGAERRGAPITAFVRYDSKRIMTRGYVFDPDVVVIADDSLDFGRMLRGLNRDSMILVNTGGEPDFLSRLTKAEVHWVNATSIALKVSGTTMFNCALLGALVRLLKDVNLEHLKEAISIELGHRGGDTVRKNQRMAGVGHRMVK